MLWLHRLLRASFDGWEQKDLVSPYVEIAINRYIYLLPKNLGPNPISDHKLPTNIDEVDGTN